MILSETARYVNIGGKNIYVEYLEINPENPTIIFLHDSLGCVQLWRDFPSKIAVSTQYNVLRYDRVGYGKSDAMDTYIRPVNYMEFEADFLNKLLDELGLNNVILFGHSDGGTIALIMSSKYPEKIKSIICEAAHIFVEEVTLKGIYEAMEAYKSSNLAERLAKYHGSKVETIFKAWTETWTRADYRNWNIEYLLKGITAPLLFIQGEADEYGTLAQVNKTIGQVSGGAEKYVIPAIGHTPHKEAPELTFQKAVEFINEIRF